MMNTADRVIRCATVLAVLGVAAVAAVASYEYAYGRCGRRLLDMDCSQLPDGTFALEDGRPSIARGPIALGWRNVTQPRASPATVECCDDAVLTSRADNEAHAA
jgi:hypothetical protein